jgi:hypothetical protein
VVASEFHYWNSFGLTDVTVFEICGAKHVQDTSRVASRMLKHYVWAAHNTAFRISMCSLSTAGCTLLYVVPFFTSESSHLKHFAAVRATCRCAQLEENLEPSGSSDLIVLTFICHSRTYFRMTLGSR